MGESPLFQRGRDWFTVAESAYVPTTDPQIWADAVSTEVQALLHPFVVGLQIIRFDPAGRIEHVTAVSGLPHDETAGLKHLLPTLQPQTIRAYYFPNAGVSTMRACLAESAPIDRVVLEQSISGSGLRDGVGIISHPEPTVGRGLRAQPR